MISFQIATTGDNDIIQPSRVTKCDSGKTKVRPQASGETKMKRIEALECVVAPEVNETFGKWIYCCWPKGVLSVKDQLWLKESGWRDFSSSSGEKTGPAVDKFFYANVLTGLILRLPVEKQGAECEHEAESREQWNSWSF